MGRELLTAWSPYSCNDCKHRRKHVPNSVPSNFDVCGHFDCNIASFTSIVINGSVSSSCNDRSHHPSLKQYGKSESKGYGKTIANFIARMNFSLKNYGCGLFYFIGTAGKVELLSTFATAVCGCSNVIDKYTMNNAADFKVTVGSMMMENIVTF